MIEERHSKIFIPVSVDKRMPNKMFNTVNSGDSWKVGYYHKDTIASERWTDDLYGKHLTFPTHWLEEKENVYVLSEQELVALLMQFEMRGRPSMVILNEERARNLAITFLKSKTNPQTENT